MDSLLTLGTAQNPSMHMFRGREVAANLSESEHIETFTPTGSLEPPVNLSCLSLDYGCKVKPMQEIQKLQQQTNEHFNYNIAVSISL